MHQPSWAGISSVKLSLLFEHTKTLGHASKTHVSSTVQPGNATGMPKRHIASLQAAGTAKLF